jgi:hypothetical protein
MKDCLELNLNANGSEFEKVLRASNSFFNTHGISKKISNEQTMVLTKLTKFLALYGRNKRSDDKIKIQINIENDKIIIEAIKSASTMDFDQIEKLEEVIQFIRGFQDPFEAFTKLKKEIIENYNSDTLLEIAKIACEGDAFVDFFVDEKMLNLSSIKYIDD